MEKLKGGPIGRRTRREAQIMAVTIYNVLDARLPGGETRRRIYKYGALLLHCFGYLDKAPRGTTSKDKAVGDFQNLYKAGGPEFITIKEAAWRKGCFDQVVEKAFKRGAIKTVDIGGNCLIKADKDFNRWKPKDLLSQ